MKSFLCCCKSRTHLKWDFQGVQILCLKEYFENIILVYEVITYNMGANFDQF